MYNARSGIGNCGRKSDRRPTQSNGSGNQGTAQIGGSGPNDAGAGRLHLMRELDRSLRRLNVDVIDIYYQHAPDAETPIEETLNALDDMVHSGKVRYIACSNLRLAAVYRTLDKRHRESFKVRLCTASLQYCESRY